MSDVTTMPTILVGNRTGGQGKTLVSQLLHYGHMLAGHEMQLVAADSSDAQDSRSKLGRILEGEVEELGIGAKMDEIRNDPRKAVAYWDRIGKHLKEGNAVIDLGANILPLVFDWAKQRRAGRLLKQSQISLVVPITAQRQSVMDGMQMIQEALDRDSQIPITDTFVIFNACHGSFADLQTKSEMISLLRMVQDSKVIRIDLAKCNTEIWEAMEADFTSLSTMAQMSHDAIAERFGLDLFAASGAQVDFTEWLEATLTAFRQAGLLPAGLAERSLQPAA